MKLSFVCSLTAAIMQLFTCRHSECKIFYISRFLRKIRIIKICFSYSYSRYRLHGLNVYIYIYKSKFFYAENYI